MKQNAPLSAYSKQIGTVLLLSASSAALRAS
jgi:hypothetical protein